MTHHLSGTLVDLPAHRLDLGAIKRLGEDVSPKQKKEVAGQDASSEKESLGFRLPAGCPSPSPIRGSLCDSSPAPCTGSRRREAPSEDPEESPGPASSPRSAGRHCAFCSWCAPSPHPGEFPHMSHQGHGSFLSLPGPVGLFLLRHDLARVDIEGDLPDRGFSRLSPSSPQPLSQNGDDPVDHPLQRRESRTFSAHPPKPSSEGVHRGNRIDSLKGQDPFIPPRSPGFQSFGRSLS